MNEKSKGSSNGHTSDSENKPEEIAASPTVGTVAPVADPNLVRENQLAQAVAKIGNSRLSTFIGWTLLLLVGLVAFFVIKWDGHMYDRRGCTKIEAIDGRIFKINSCDDSVIELSSAKHP